MKKYFLALCLMASTAMAVATGGSVFGYGGFRNPTEGVATFRMQIEEDSLGTASFLFASEGTHGDYPDTVFKSVQVTQYMNLASNRVRVHGRGLLYNMIPVFYMATFTDGGNRGADHLELHAWNSRNGAHIVHFAEYLTEGVIVVTPGR